MSKEIQHGNEAKISSELLHECSQFMRCLCEQVFSFKQNLYDLNSSSNKYLKDNSVCSEESTTKMHKSIKLNLTSIEEFPSLGGNQEQVTPNKKLANNLEERMKTPKHCSSTPKTLFDKENSLPITTNSFPKKLKKNKKKTSFKRIDLNLPTKKHPNLNENGTFLKRKKHLNSGNIQLSIPKNHNQLKPPNNKKDAFERRFANLNIGDTSSCSQLPPKSFQTNVAIQTKESSKDLKINKICSCSNCSEFANLKNAANDLSTLFEQNLVSSTVSALHNFLQIIIILHDKDSTTVGIKTPRFKNNNDNLILRNTEDILHFSVFCLQNLIKTNFKMFNLLKFANFIDCIKDVKDCVIIKNLSELVLKISSEVKMLISVIPEYKEGKDIIPFDEEADSKHAFPNETAFHSFIKVKDIFYSLYKINIVFENNEPKIREIFRSLKINKTYRWFVRLFLRQLLKSCPLNLPQSQYLKSTDKSLHFNLFTSSTSINVLENLKFFQDFVSEAENYLFNNILLEEICKIIKLKEKSTLEFQYFCDECMEIPDTDIESFNELMCHMRCLGNFYGFLISIVGTFNQVDELNDDAETDVLQPLPHLVESVVQHLNHALKTSLKKGHLLVTLTWLMPVFCQIATNTTWINHECVLDLARMLSFFYRLDFMQIYLFNKMYNAENIYKHMYIVNVIK